MSPITAPSSVNGSDKATVFFYRSSDICGLPDIGDKVVIVNYTEREGLPDDYEGYRGKDYFEKDEILVSNRKVYSSLDIAPGIHTFSFLGMYKQTVRLEAGNSYYLAVNFTCVPGFLYQPIFSLEFRTKEAFIKDTKDMALVRITKGFKLNTIFKTYRYEVIQRPD